MDCRLLVTIEGAEPTRIAAATRQLLKEIRVDADPHAYLTTQDTDPHAKGSIVDLGQIALALITGGAVGKLIDSLFSYLSRNRKVAIEIENGSGEKLKLNMDFVDHHGLDKAMSLTKTFLHKGR